MKLILVYMIGVIVVIVMMISRVIVVKTHGRAPLFFETNEVMLRI
jgi:hypothetical protein